MKRFTGNMFCLCFSWLLVARAETSQVEYEADAIAEVMSSDGKVDADYSHAFGERLLVTLPPVLSTWTCVRDKLVFERKGTKVKSMKIGFTCQNSFSRTAILNQVTCKRDQEDRHESEVILVDIDSKKIAILRVSCRNVKKEK